MGLGQRANTHDTVSTYTVGGGVISVNGVYNQHGSLGESGVYMAWT